MSQSRYQVIILAALLPLLAPGVHAADPATSTAAQAATGKLTVAQVKSEIDSKQPLYIFDANERESYLAGHIPGARWVKFNAVTAAVLPKSKDAKLLFYCYNPLCDASPLAASDARKLGYRNVWLMPEGITGWRKAGMAVVAGERPE